MLAPNNHVFEGKSGFTRQQWVLLACSFLLGIAAVFTVDKLFLTHSGSSGTAHAAVSCP